jgi:hypothetical protein
VKKVKLRINPVTIPKGRDFPPPTALERTIGRIGRMHGERTVTIPAMKENSIKSNIKVRRGKGGSRNKFGMTLKNGSTSY